MKTFRSILLWMHLAVGSLAGVVILIMSVTGVALTYEKQMLEWADRNAWTAPLSLTLRADASAPATVTLEGNKALLVDPYTGAIIGAPPTGLRTFFRSMTSWHRYLALEGASRATGRALTGASNFIFLFILLSGMYLWLPRVWKWIQFKNVLWFRGGLTPKARDFNWHNVIGIWSSIPLAIVVAGAMPISYPWASNLVYRLVGEAPPTPPGQQQAARPGVPERAPGGPRALSFAGIDNGWARVQSQARSWRTMSVRLAAPQAPLLITVDSGYGGQPNMRSTVTVNRATGAVEKWETFESLSPGRRLRSWLRFAHTGEIYGLTGQTIAGLASAGGAVLVYTGIALALRRLVAWIDRLRRRAYDEDRQRAA